MFLKIFIKYESNSDIENWYELDQQIYKILNVTFVSHNIDYICAIIPITNHTEHKGHFNFIKDRIFAKFGIVVEKEYDCIDKLDMYIFDLNSYFRHDAKPIKGII